MSDIKITCEYALCNETKGRDYIRKTNVAGWHGEPIFLCDEHAVGFEPLVKKGRAFFKLCGLSKPASFTCESMYNEDLFWAKSGIPQDRFDALFEYCGGNWQNLKFVEIEHEGLYNDGTPIKPIVISIKEG